MRYIFTGIICLSGFITLAAEVVVDLNSELKKILSKKEKTYNESVKDKKHTREIKEIHQAEKEFIEQLIKSGDKKLKCLYLIPFHIRDMEQRASLLKVEGANSTELLKEIKSSDQKIHELKRIVLKSPYHVENLPKLNSDLQQYRKLIRTTVKVLGIEKRYKVKTDDILAGKKAAIKKFNRGLNRVESQKKEIKENMGKQIENLKSYSKGIKRQL
ncbi:MAG: hypothetical protein MJH11_21200, partial [Lentisphaeria bacterium]|nr:hypothetical protein [Lentisphaeria bacterium]